MKMGVHIIKYGGMICEFSEIIKAESRIVCKIIKPNIEKAQI